MVTNNILNASSTGLLVLNSAGAFLGRTVTGTANQISVSNGDGISGNPTLALTSTIYTNISFDAGTTTLSSYSTGTFTPTLTGSTTNPTVTYTTQVGRYTRVGNRVFLTINVELSAKSADGTGNFQISSLPFAGAGATNRCTASIQNTTYGGTILWNHFSIGSGSSVVGLIGNRSAAGLATFAITAISATTKCNLSTIYEV